MPLKYLTKLSLQIFFVERIGRRPAFIAGAVMMGILFLIIAIIDATHPVSSTSTGTPTPPAIASVLMIYLEAFTYNLSWGPLAWLYLGEIFPNRVREIGIALGCASQWLWNFVMSQITPHALDNIGWRTFLMFAIFNAAIAVYSWVFLKETKGRSLEEMEVLWGSKETSFDVEGVRRRARSKDRRLEGEGEERHGSVSKSVAEEVHERA